MTIPLNGTLDLGASGRVSGLLDPAAAQDAATKAYVDSLVEGLQWKDSARAASTANINLASPGAAIDGVTMVAGDRFLAKNQTAPAENGLYVWNGAATPATRTLDMSVAAEVEAAIATVEEGTANAGTTWRQTAVNVTLGTTALAWTSFGVVAPAASETTAGISEYSTQAETDAGVSDTTAVTPLKLATWSGRLRKYSTTVGDGASTSLVVTHNLNTLVVQVYVYETGGSKRQVQVEIQHTGVNSVTLVPGTAPAAAAWTVVVIG